MPAGHFEPVLDIIDGKLHVKGPLDPPDRDTEESLIMAVVTQPASPPDSARAVTVRGSIRLSKKDAMLPNLFAKLAKAPRTQRFGDEWSFTQHPSTGALRSGPAYATAVQVNFKTDGAIETYAWSEWITVSAS